MIRRDFIKGLGASLLALEVGDKTTSLSRLLASSDRGSIEDHFLIVFDIPGGVDPLYLFDSRDEYFEWSYYAPFVPNTDIEKWNMTDGSSLLLAPAAENFKRHLRDFSVLNGVHMLENFPGHPQNINYMFTGSVGGGNCYIPEINQGIGSKPLDFVRLGHGVIEAQFSNMAEGVLASSEALNKLRNSVQILPPSLWDLKWKHDMNQYFDKYEFGKTELWKNTKSRFKKSLSFLEIVRDGIASELKEADTQYPSDSANLSFALNLMKYHLTKSILFVFDSSSGLDGNLDCHFEVNHLNLHRDLSKIMSRISSMVDLMKNTEFGSGKSFFDVCTVVVCSEFGRTFVNRKTPYAQQGTDHNPFNNTFLIGGRGIKSGQVIGSSDFRISESKDVLSKAHLQKDPYKIASFGHVFDFKSCSSVLEALPEIYESNHYLTGNSVMNTILELFAVPRSKFRGLDNTSELAPIIKKILA